MNNKPSTFYFGCCLLAPCLFLSIASKPPYNKHFTTALEVIVVLMCLASLGEESEREADNRARVARRIPAEASEAPDHETVEAPANNTDEHSNPEAQESITARQQLRQLMVQFYRLRGSLNACQSDLIRKDEDRDNNDDSRHPVSVGV